MEYIERLARILMDNPVLLIPMATFLFSLVAKLTPSKSDDELVDRLWDAVHMIAMNPRSDRARPSKMKA